MLKTDDFYWRSVWMKSWVNEFESIAFLYEKAVVTSINNVYHVSGGSVGPDLYP
jgi:hypothetical protein